MDVFAPSLAKAHELGLRPAEARLRFWSYAIDYSVGLAALLPAGIGYLLYLITGQYSTVPLVLTGASGLLLVIYLVVLLSLNGRKGSSPGKAAMRLRAVRLADFAAPGFLRILALALVFLGSQLIPVIGPLLLLLSCLFDRRHRRGWLDKLAGTYVIDIRSGIDSTNERVLARAKYLLARPDRDISEHLPALGTAAVETDFASRPRSSAGIVGAQNSDWQASAGGERRTGRRAALAFDDGSYIPVPASGLIGRAPVADAAPSGSLLIPLADPERLLSKNHLSFGRDGAEVWIMDLGSSNGTQLTVASGRPHNVPAGTRVHVHDGDSVQIGSRTFRITSQETDK